MIGLTSPKPSLEASMEASFLAVSVERHHPCVLCWEKSRNQLAHEDIGSGIRIFYKRRHESELYIVPKGNPLTSSYDSFGDGLITMKIHIGMTISTL